MLKSTKVLFSLCLAAAYIGRAWPLINLYSTFIKFCNIPCIFPPVPINFLKPSSSLTQLFSFIASTALAAILQVKMASGCMLQLSLHLRHFHLRPSPSLSNMQAELQGIQKQFGGDCSFQATEYMWEAADVGFWEAKCSGCLLSLSFLHCCTIYASQCCWPSTGLFSPYFQHHSSESSLTHPTVIPSV